MNLRRESEKKNPLLSVNEKKVLKLESETVNGEVEGISSYNFGITITKLWIILIE